MVCQWPDELGSYEAFAARDLVTQLDGDAGPHGVHRQGMQDRRVVALGQDALGLSDEILSRREVATTQCQ